MGAQYPNVMKQTTQTSQFSPEQCAKWLNQLSEVKAQITSSYEASNIVECISDVFVNIENHLDEVAFDICEILKQQSLRDNFFYFENNNQ